MTTMQKCPRLSWLHCLMEQDQETGLFMWHCLDLDLIECGPTNQEAWANLKRIIKNHVEYCYFNYPEGLAISAERHEWEAFYRMLKENAPIQVEEIEIDLQRPLPEEQIPIWIQGVINAHQAAYV